MVLSNNNFQFDSSMFLRLVGTAIGTKFAPTFGYLEQAIFSPRILSLYFKLTECKSIKKYFSVLWMMVLFYGQKKLILMYLESFSMNYIPH